MNKAIFPGISVICIIVFFSYLLVIVIMANNEQQDTHQKCKDLIGNNEAYYTDKDKDHFNCCWSEIVKTEKLGYQQEKRCKGYDIE